MTRVNSAIPSYCSCRQRGTFHRPAVHRRDGARLRRPTGLGRLLYSTRHREKDEQDRLDFHSFIFTAISLIAKRSPHPLPLLRCSVATSKCRRSREIPPRSNSRLYFNHLECYPVPLSGQAPHNLSSTTSNFYLAVPCASARFLAPSFCLGKLQIRKRSLTSATIVPREFGIEAVNI